MKLYRELKKKMIDVDADQSDIAKVLGKSANYISKRFLGRYGWEIDDCYKICDFLGTPYSDVSVLFPKNGGIANDKKYKVI